MAQLVELNNGHIKASIAPANGGMLASLTFGGKEVLLTDMNILRLSPMLAGGCPILFPFSSTTENDCYEYEGKSYSMPMHGLVKNEAFAVSSKSDDELTLYIESNDAWIKSLYPFKFRLEVKYSLLIDGVKISMTVKNLDEKTLYHSLGLHPFFFTSDRTKTELKHSFSTCYDYVKHADKHPAPKYVDLCLDWDNVCHSPKGNEIVYTNEGDKYEAIIKYDDNFDVLAVCNNRAYSLCLEPWCGLPDEANIKHFAKYVEAGESKTYEIEIHLRGI